MAREERSAAIEIVNENGASRTLLVCEHASMRIPARYRDLGLAPRDRERHIAWDIGAAAVTRALAAAIDAPAYLGTYSRLLIDLNRPIDAPSSIPERSEATEIPGNIGLSEAERNLRRETIFAPFQACVSERLDRRRPDRIVAIHSFTPVFLGVARPWHIGILYGAARDFGESVLAALGADRSLRVGANVPYVIDRSEDYTVPIHGDDRGVPAILVEIRNDLIREPRGVAEWAARLAAALGEAPLDAPTST